MNEERITESPSWNDPRGQVMKTPDDVAEMLRLRACGWGLKQIARQLGCSHHTVKNYVAAGGVKPFKSPRRPKKLDGHEEWLRERFIRHRGNADVVRQDLLAEKGVAVSRRTLQRAVQPYRQALKAEALATTRFETPPGRQLQIDFGERLVEIGGPKLLIVDELGYLPLEPDAAHLFFQLVSRRYETGTMLITSNRSVAEWGMVVATAILDRLLHHSHVLMIRGDSYRLRAKRKSGLIKPPAGDGPPVGSASLRPVTGGTNLQPRS
jgi:hypothetical protein